MKKSFKKAGAAVLSMSMLLAMGASAMPVYAVDAPGTAGKSTNDIVNPYTGTGTSTVGSSTLPGAVYISLSDSLLYRQGEGVDDNHPNGGVDENDPDGKYRYDYLPPKTAITDAQVTIYRVAELSGENGWSWVSGLSTAPADIEELTALLSTTVLDDNGNTVSTPEAFEMLLERVGNTDSGEFATKSSELKNLASWLERHSSQLTQVATGTLNNANQKIGFSLPEIDPDLMASGYSDPSTINKIGYYLITTTTDQAGVLVQPVLISLKNGQENPKNISLKGSTINIEKRITDVGTEDKFDTRGSAPVEYAAGTEDSAKDGIKDNHDKYIYGEDSVVTGGTRATVGKNDVVHYEISAQLPQYDTKLAADATGLVDFVIHDYAGEGLTILPSTIKAYVSTEDESEVGTNRTDAAETKDNWYLTGTDTRNSGDYSVSTTGYNGHGFDLTITLAQMRGDSTIVTGSTKGTETDTANKGKLTTMENKFIIVSFDAVVNKNATGGDAANDAAIAFDRSYIDPMSVSKTDGSITYSSDVTTANQTTKLNAIYDEWVSYVNGSGYAQGVEEAVLAAKAAGTYRDYLTGAPLAALTTTVGNVTNMYEGYTTAAKLAQLKKADGTAYASTDIDSKVAEEVPKEKIIALLLAIDHYNSTRNGETNYADMTYGNNYSTGAGMAKDVTNDTTVYSVDMNLNKFVEKLTLTHKDAVPTAATINDYYTLNELKALAASVTVPDGYSATATEANVKAAFGDDALNEMAAADQTKLFYVIDQKVTEVSTKLTANDNYWDTWIKEAVKDVVFELTDPDGNKSYAVSLGDDTTDDTKDGILMQLVPSTHASAPTSTDTTVKYYVKEADNSYTWYSLPATGAETAWVMFQQGEYTLKEVLAPTGFKKWANDVTIKIEALDGNLDAVTDSTKPDGAYQATGYSATNTEIASKQTEVGKGIESNPVTFTYWTTGKENKASAGVLQHNIYNEYQDTLPATGGIGTVLFTAGGISVVLIAGALFVMYMKKKNSEDEE